MDADQLNALSGDHKGKYMALERLFAQPGFKYLVEWAKAQVSDCAQREMNAPSWDHVLLQRGARLAYVNFVEIEKLTEDEFAAIAQEELDRKALTEDEKVERIALDHE
jgi:hypothetical protein